jgi:TonB-linked SusC/RagA family outer membrane protein
MNRISFMLTFLLLIGSLVVNAQGKQVSGTVTSSEDGLGIPGVSVVVKGTSIGTSTDIDGNYTIVLPEEGKVLVYSFVGMTSQEIEVKSSTVNVVMNPEAIGVDEVMVVAYGVTKKASFTGSASVVDSEKLEDVPVASVEKLLQGTSPGVVVQSSSGQPGASTTVRIRGVGSITASSSPLYVIDGVAVNTGDYSSIAPSADVLATLNPDDIASMTILKDASAAALYGARAANGVVVITTKKGKANEARINFKAQWGVSQLPSGGYDLMSSDQHYKTWFNSYYNQNLKAGMGAAAAAEAANASAQTAIAYNPYNVANPLDANGNLVEGAKLVVDTDWIDEVYRTGKSQEYNLSASGGTEKSKYFLSGAYYSNEGIMTGSDLERFNARINLSSELRDFLTVGMETGLSHTIQNSVPDEGAGASPMRMSLLFPNGVPMYLQDQNGNYIDEKGNLTDSPVYNYDNGVSMDFNPIATTQDDIYKTKMYRVLTNLWAEAKLAKGLKFKSTFAVDYNAINEERFYNPYHGNGASVDGRGTRYNTTSLMWTSTNLLTYDFRLNEDHHLNFTGGFEAWKDQYQRVYAEGVGYADLGGITMSELDMAARPEGVGSISIDETMASYFSRLNYDFKDRYYLSMSFRRDGSSKFGDDKKWGNFYSVGASWRVTEEDFMKDINWMDDLKLRASYGTSGNNKIDNYSYAGLFEGGWNYNGNPGFTHSQLPNSSIQWESQKTFDIGLEARLFNRLSLSYDYYVKKNEDLLFGMPLPGSTGFTEITTNFADMKNTGHELSINFDAIVKKDFRWNVNFNISTNENELLKLSQEQTLDENKIWEVGGDIQQFYMQEWAGYAENGAPQWYMLNENGEKVITQDYNSADKFKVGSALPDFTGSLTNSFSYKGFDFSFMFYYSLGGKIYDSVEAQLMNDGSDLGKQLMQEVANDPGFIAGTGSKANYTSSRFLHDGSFIKLKNVSLSYNFPKRIISKANLSNLKVFVTGNNLLTLTKDEFKGYDPEAAISGNLDFYIPNPKTITFGVNIGL